MNVNYFLIKGIHVLCINTLTPPTTPTHCNTCLKNVIPDTSRIQVVTALTEILATVLIKTIINFYCLHWLTKPNNNVTDINVLTKGCVRNCVITQNEMGYMKIMSIMSICLSLCLLIWLSLCPNFCEGSITCQCFMTLNWGRLLKSRSHQLGIIEF